MWHLLRPSPAVTAHLAPDKSGGRHRQPRVGDGDILEDHTRAAVQGMGQVAREGLVGDIPEFFHQPAHAARKSTRPATPSAPVRQHLQAGAQQLHTYRGNALYSHIAASIPGQAPRFTHKRAQEPLPVLSHPDFWGTPSHSPLGAPKKSGAPASHRSTAARRASLYLARKAARSAAVRACLPPCAAPPGST